MYSRFVNIVTPSGTIVQFDNEHTHGAVITTLSDINLNLYPLQQFRRLLKGPSDGPGAWEETILDGFIWLGIL